MDLEAKIKEMESKVESLGLVLTEKDATIKGRDEEITTLTADNVALAAQVVTLEEEKKSLSKEMAIEKANAQGKEDQVEADKITAEALKNSPVGEKFHDKVIAMVNHSDYMTEDGAFDKAAFKVEFEAEVKDWETKMLGKSGAGLGAAGVKSADDTEDDQELGKKIARKYVGNIRSDQK